MFVLKTQTPPEYRTTRLRRGLLLALTLFVTAVPCHAYEKHKRHHEDAVTTDPSLTLPKLIDLTLQKYPDEAWLAALEEEASALKKRSESWTAGASQAGLRFQEATSGTLHYIDGTVQVPLWNLGQRDAQEIIASHAKESAELQAQAIKLRVSGLVRDALWYMELQQVRYDQAKIDVAAYEQLFSKIQKRVELGDLPQADLLLAQTELLQKQALMVTAEANLMDSRRRYASVTQLTKIPSVYKETLAPLTEIESKHPLLAAINSQIERKRAELDATHLIGSGQTNVTVGINSDRPSNQDPRSNNTESFNIGVTVPFGGSAHLAPQLAAINVELNRLIAQQQQLYRDLELAHHEAEHNLQVNEDELEIANQLKETSEQHLKMIELSFSVGEINLLDLIKIQTQTQQAILNAKERSVILQRDIAFYNQAVGVMP